MTVGKVKKKFGKIALYYFTSVYILKVVCRFC